MAQQHVLQACTHSQARAPLGSALQVVGRGSKSSRFTARACQVGCTMYCASQLNTSRISWIKEQNQHLGVARQLLDLKAAHPC